MQRGWWPLRRRRVAYFGPTKDPTNEGLVTVNEYIDDHPVPCFQPLTDVHNAEWQTKVRKELLEVPDKSDEDVTVADNRADDSDPPLGEPKFQSVREALAAADDLATFAEFHGNEELVQAASKVTTLLNKMCDISLKQTTLDFFISFKRK